MSHNTYQWRTSSRSSNGENCVEVAPTPEGAIIRHSRHPDAGTIEFTHAEWLEFLDDAHSGASPGRNEVATITGVGNGAVVRSVATGVTLTFDDGEWSAFIAGAADREFEFSTSTGNSAR